MTGRPGSARWLGLAVFAVIAGAACAGDATVTEPMDRLLPQAAITTPTDAFDATDRGKAFVCVVSPVAGTYTYGITGTGSPVIPVTPVSPAPGTCVEVATSVAAPATPDGITSTEMATPGNVQLTGVTVEQALWSCQTQNGTPCDPLDPTPTAVATTDPASGSISREAAIRITYYYDEIVVGGEGCTPGYWKQEHHFDSWVNYAPTDLFSSVFEDAFSGMTLEEVLGQGGGGLKALGRHTVAALLNAASGINFGMTEQDVIDAFNAVYPGGDYEGLKDELVALNESGCPLN